MYQQTSPEQVKQRRDRLRQQRRERLVVSLWRWACMGGIVAGLGWVFTQINWQISTPDRIQVEGNQYLTDATIRSMLALRYPVSIVELAPAQMSEKLLAGGSIERVQIDRELLPPRLVVRVKDTPPVASVLTDDDRGQPQIFVDERGRLVSAASYRSTALQTLPQLRIEMPSQGGCPSWNYLYPAVRSSPVAIGIIDCRDPHNLFLQTEIGKVRLGAVDAAQIGSQLQQLDSLRNWQQHTDATAVDYVDLENPNSPKLQLK